MMARYNRAEKFLGISSSPVHSTVLDDENEFKEEDVWDTDAREWPEESSTQESHMYGGSGGGGGHMSHRNDSNESFRYFNNGRRWMGDQGLSVAFAGDAAGGGRSRGLSSLSPVKGGSSSSGMSSGRESTPGRIATASRMIPPTGYQHHHQRESSSRQMMHHHQSAPVNVPDWTRMVGAEKKSVARGGNEYFDKEKDDDEDDDDEKERLPPHELLARENANSQATTFSVFEGAGRTLKGRDLSRVRNAVLRKTGFIDL